MQILKIDETNLVSGGATINYSLNYFLVDGNEIDAVDLTESKNTLNYNITTTSADWSCNCYSVCGTQAAIIMKGSWLSCKSVNYISVRADSSCGTSKVCQGTLVSLG